MKHILILALFSISIVTMAQERGNMEGGTWNEDGSSNRLLLSEATPNAAKHEILAEHLSIMNESMSFAWNNPAIMEMAYKSSLTQFSTGVDWQRQSGPFELQQGTGHVLASINADTYLRLSQHSAVWGKASYMTGRMRDIKWNSVADYDILNPDILGDTVGGNTRREQYVFNGGYARNINLWRVGAQMLFRAEQEYRKTDPRMRSIVTDLTLRAGALRELGTTNLGASVEGNIYRQTSSVDFYKPMGSIPEYQLMGLGTTFTRFSGDINDLFFKGGGLKLQADVAPSNNGMFSSIWVSQHHYERVARLLNSLPLTTLYNKEIGTRLGWKHDGKLNYAIWGDVKYNRRSSDQHIAGTSSSQIYPVIAHLTMYKNHVLNTSVSGGIGARKGEIDWIVMAQAGFSSNRHKFVQPHRSMNYSHAYGCVQGQMIASLSKSWTLTGLASISYYGNLTKKLVLPLADMEPHFIEMLSHNYRFLSADYANAATHLRADYHFPKSHYSIFVEASYGYSHCWEDECQNNLTVTIGVNL